MEGDADPDFHRNEAVRRQQAREDEQQEWEGHCYMAPSRPEATPEGQARRCYWHHHGGIKAYPDLCTGCWLRQMCRAD